MSAKEKKFQDKSLKVYRGAAIAMLCIKFVLLLIADVAMFVYAFDNPNSYINVALEIGIVVSTFLLGSIFKELMIRTER